MSSLTDKRYIILIIYQPAVESRNDCATPNTTHESGWQSIIYNNIALQRVEKSTNKLPCDRRATIPACCNAFHGVQSMNSKTDNCNDQIPPPPPQNTVTPTVVMSKPVDKHNIPLRRQTTIINNATERERAGTEQNQCHAAEVSPKGRQQKKKHVRARNGSLRSSPLTRVRSSNYDTVLSKVKRQRKQSQLRAYVRHTRPPGRRRRGGGGGHGPPNHSTNIEHRECSTTSCPPAQHTNQSHRTYDQSNQVATRQVPHPPPPTFPQKAAGHVLDKEAKNAKRNVLERRTTARAVSLSHTHTTKQASRKHAKRIAAVRTMRGQGSAGREWRPECSRCRWRTWPDARSPSRTRRVG